MFAQVTQLVSSIQNIHTDLLALKFRMLFTITLNQHFSALKSCYLQNSVIQKAKTDMVR